MRNSCAHMRAHARTLFSHPQSISRGDKSPSRDLHHHQLLLLELLHKSPRPLGALLIFLGAAAPHGTMTPTTALRRCWIFFSFLFPSVGFSVSLLFCLLVIHPFVFPSLCPSARQSVTLYVFCQSDSPIPLSFLETLFHCPIIH